MAGLQFQIKTYNELSKEDLYAVLYLRSEIFVVEQDCVYQDIDYKDQKAMHILGFKKTKLLAYARIFKPNDYFEYASIGRVLVIKKERKHQYGYDLMKTAIEAIKKHFNEDSIAISAQKHLHAFYNNLGFSQKKEEYLEDGIPHIYMEFNRKCVTNCHDSR